MSRVRSEFKCPVFVSFGVASACSKSGGDLSPGVGVMDVDGELYDCSR